jgi:hypothetical protein
MPWWAIALIAGVVLVIGLVVAIIIAASKIDYSGRNDH